MNVSRRTRHQKCCSPKVVNLFHLGATSVVWTLYSFQLASITDDFKLRTFTGLCHVPKLRQNLVVSPVNAIHPLHTPRPETTTLCCTKMVRLMCADFDGFSLCLLDS
jgi:hypothetical protein